jgi:hypothetical protein
MHDVLTDLFIVFMRLGMSLVIIDMTMSKLMRRMIRQLNLFEPALQVLSEKI